MWAYGLNFPSAQGEFHDRYPLEFGDYGVCRMLEALYVPQEGCRTNCRGEERGYHAESCIKLVKALPDFANAWLFIARVLDTLWLMTFHVCKLAPLLHRSPVLRHSYWTTRRAAERLLEALKPDELVLHNIQVAY
jgi:hypothetical protein